MVAKKLQLFVSYAHKDSAFVDRLVKELEDHEVEVWRDTREILVGQSVIAEIESALEKSDAACLILSNASANRPWVLQEYYAALEKHLSRQTDFKLLPLLIEDCSIPNLLRGIKYADFRSEFAPGFDELLTTLNLGPASTERPKYRRSHMTLNRDREFGMAFEGVLWVLEHTMNYQGSEWCVTSPYCLNHGELLQLIDAHGRVHEYDTKLKRLRNGLPDEQSVDDFTLFCPAAAESHPIEASWRIGHLHYMAEYEFRSRTANDGD